MSYLFEVIDEPSIGFSKLGWVTALSITGSQPSFNFYRLNKTAH